MGALDERSLVEQTAELLWYAGDGSSPGCPRPCRVGARTGSAGRRDLIIPVFVDDEGLHVAVAQPSDELRFVLAETSGHSVRLRLAPMSDIRWAIDRSYQAIGRVDQAVQLFEAVEVSKKRPVVVERTATVDDALGHSGRDRQPSVPRCLGRPHRAVGQRDVRPLPDRRGPQGRARASGLDGHRFGQSHQDHGEHQHRRRSHTGWPFSVEVDGNPTDVRVATVATIWVKSARSASWTRSARYCVLRCPKPN